MHNGPILPSPAAVTATQGNTEGNAEGDAEERIMANPLGMLGKIMVVQTECDSKSAPGLLAVMIEKAQGLAVGDKTKVVIATYHITIRKAYEFDTKQFAVCVLYVWCDSPQDHLSLRARVIRI